MVKLAKKKQNRNKKKKRAINIYLFDSPYKTVLIVRKNIKFNV